ncbi:LacI family DNA-binding transcriptional regulator [Consotaella salsifontis]|uniref:Transcriptional regulator, LacI family n=1 Tax=Consotaella salsifontis TaxID=1365950 RepID=A0A1T4LIM0_9HYPH|nr:LacI family DNA-binding transcriptional regulator [Consotaella salsifontis]SJZ54446.1 transcriptional regulator, LacI family [Consotaella salsifontis]
MPNNVKGAGTGPTIKQLAQTLGMAHSTVSRALNDHPAISDATKERIRRAAAEFGYVPNTAARMLRTSQSGIVGLVVPDIVNPFFSRVAKSISSLAMEHRWQVVLSDTAGDPERERLAVESLLRTRAEGVIISVTEDPLPETIEMLGRLRVVQFLRSHPSIRAPVVKIGDFEAVATATAHLQSLGHTNIGFIGSPASLSTGFERRSGFLSRFPSRPPEEDLVVCGPVTPEFGTEAFLRMISRDDPPTAIVLGSASYSQGVAVAANRARIQIPEDLSIVGFGDTYLNEVLLGGLTTMVLPLQEIADTCVETLRLSFAQSERAAEAGDGLAIIQSLPARLLLRSTTRKLDV